MRLLPIALPAAFLLAAALTAERTRSEEFALVFAPAEGASVERTFDSKGEYSLESVEFLLDGEAPPGGLPDPDLDIEATEHIVVRDELGAVDAGRPAKLKRTFETLDWTVTYSTESGPEERTEERTCDLEGLGVVFEWDAEDDGYARKYDEDSEGDESLLEHLDEDMDLRAFLPDDAVEIDATWPLGRDAYLALVYPGGNLPTHVEGQGPDELDQAISLALREAVEVEGEAKLSEVTEEDGRRVAHIHFTLSVSAKADVEGPGEASGITFGRNLQRELEGTLLWDVAGAHPVSLEGQAASTLVMRTSGEVEDPEGNTHEIEQSQSFEGQVTYDVTFEYE